MKDNREKTFIEWSDDFGRASGLTMIFIMMTVPMIACQIFDMWPDFRVLLATAIIPIMILMMPNGAADTVAYPTLIGNSSIYLAAMTGNTYSQKLPCALITLRIMGIETGTELAAVVSLIAVCTASIATTIILIVAAIAGATVLSPIVNSEFLSPAWNNVLPALLGSLIVSMAWGKEKWKYFVAPLSVGMIMAFFTGLSLSYYMIICLIVAVSVGLLLNKMKPKA